MSTWAVLVFFLVLRFEADISRVIRALIARWQK